MKKIALSLAGTLLLSTLVFAQYQLPNRIFKKSQTDLRFSIGLVPTFFADGGRQVVPPLSLGGDRMLNDFLSLGVTLGYSSTISKELIVLDGLKAQWRNNFLEAGLRGAVHVTRFDNLDIYGGFAVSWFRSRVKPVQGNLDAVSHHLGIEARSSRIVPGAILGFRYAIQKNWTLHAEAGYGVSIFQVGFGRLL